jgi:hypothetical protein
MSADELLAALTELTAGQALTGQDRAGEAGRHGAQRGAVGFAGGQDGELVQGEDELRRLEAGHLALGEPGAARGQVEGGGRLDEGGHPLTHVGIGHGHGHGVAHRGVGLEGGLHLRRRDVLAGPDDDVGQASGDPEPSVVVEDAQVAGAEPASWLGDDPGGGPGVGVPDEELGTPEPQLPGVAGTETGAGGRDRAR